MPDPTQASEQIQQKAHQKTQDNLDSASGALDVLLALSDLSEAVSGAGKLVASAIWHGVEFLVDGISGL